MSQAEAVLRKEVQRPLKCTSSPRHRLLRPLGMFTDALRGQLELSRQRDALRDAPASASFGRDTGCRC